MTDNIQLNNQIDENNKAVSLFTFIRELNKLKQKAVVNYSEYPWARTLSSLPDDPDNITVCYRDRVENEDLADDSNVLLSVRNPEFEKCPVPDSIFEDWLKTGWDSFKNEPEYFEVRPTTQNETLLHAEANPDIDEKTEYFADNPNRVIAYNKWVSKRKEWVERQKIILQTKNLFSDLYRLYFELQRESETKELIGAKK